VVLKRENCDWHQAEHCKLCDQSVIDITFLLTSLNKSRKQRARNVKNHISASNSVQFLNVNHSVCAWANDNMV
jgi:hypothetical protein